MIKVLLGFIFFSVISDSFADVSYFLSAAQSFGGDNIVLDNSGRKDAGKGLSGEFGISTFQMGDSYSFTTSLGLKGDIVTLDGEDKYALFTTFPVTAIFHFEDPRYRIGAGLTYHLNPTNKIRCTTESFLCQDQNYSFDNAIGWLVEINYALSHKAFLGIRYTDIEYKLQSVDGLFVNPTLDTFDASSLSLQISIKLLPSP